MINKIFNFKKLLHALLELKGHSSLTYKINDYKINYLKLLLFLIIKTNKFIIINIK